MDFEIWCMPFSRLTLEALRLNPEFLPATWRLIHGATKASPGTMDALQNLVGLFLEPGSIKIVPWVTVEQVWLVMSNQRFFKIVCLRFPTNVPKKIEHIRF